MLEIQDRRNLDPRDFAYLLYIPGFVYFESFDKNHQHFPHYRLEILQISQSEFFDAEMWENLFKSIIKLS